MQVVRQSSAEVPSLHSIRRLTPQDLPELLDLSHSAGWNQTPEDWRLLLDLEPEGCFGVEVDARIVATTTLLCHRRQLAWLGMVLSHPNYRRRGFARQLVARALERARYLGIPTVKLDATGEGRPLYESFGFRAEQPIERWIRNGGTQPQPFALKQRLPDIRAIDAEACGYDRRVLIDRLSLRSHALAGSSAYLLCRPGRLRAYLGPCVARHASEGRRLMTAVLQQAPEASWCWDLLPGNEDAVSLARDSGFTRHRVLTRMVLGPDLGGRNEWVYAIAGFELG